MVKKILNFCITNHFDTICIGPTYLLPNYHMKILQDLNNNFPFYLPFCEGAFYI